MLVNSSSCKLSTESPTGVLNRDVFANFVHPNAKKAILVGKILNMTSHRNETFDSRHNLQVLQFKAYFIINQSKIIYFSFSINPLMSYFISSSSSPMKDLKEPCGK